MRIALVYEAPGRERLLQNRASGSGGSGAEGAWGYVFRTIVEPTTEYRKGHGVFLSRVGMSSKGLFGSEGTERFVLLFVDVDIVVFLGQVFAYAGNLLEVASHVEGADTLKEERV